MKVRVLLVDDEKEFLEPLAERLEIRGFDVSTAFSGRDALTIIQKKELDVVVLDVKMPGMDGIDVLRQIKRFEPLVEVIMLTGYATVPTAIEGMKLGAFDFLLKPSETGDLIIKIEEAHKRKADQEERIRKAEINGIIKRRGW